MPFERVTAISIGLVLSACFGAAGLMPTGLVAETRELQSAVCDVGGPVRKLLSEGSKQRSTWVILFREMPGDDDVQTRVVEAFLNDWQKGDRYRITNATCFDNNRPRIFFDLAFSTERMGDARLTGELVDTTIIPLSFFLSSLLQVE